MGISERYREDEASDKWLEMESHPNVPVAACVDAFDFVGVPQYQAREGSAICPRGSQVGNSCLRDELEKEHGARLSFFRDDNLVKHSDRGPLCPIMPVCKCNVYS